MSREIDEKRFAARIVVSNSAAALAEHFLHLCDELEELIQKQLHSSPESIAALDLEVVCAFDRLLDAEFDDPHEAVDRIRFLTSHLEKVDQQGDLFVRILNRIIKDTELVKSSLRRTLNNVE